MKYFGSWAVVAIALAALIFAAPDAAAEKLAISQYGRVTATLPWAIAMKKGFLKQNGLNIDEFVSGAGGGTTLRNMLAGDLPFAEVATSAALAALRSGIDIKIVATTSNHIGEIALVTLPNSPIHTIKDLAGKKAGFTGAKSTSEMLLRMVLEKNGLSGKVELVATGGFGPGLTALDLGGIDAAPLIDPVLTLQPEKYRRLFTFADLIPQVTWLVDVATTDFIQKQPEKLRALIRAHREAVDYLYAHPDEAQAIYAEVWGANPADVAKFFPKYFKLPGEWTRGEFDKAGLAAMSAGVQLIGDEPKPVDWKAIIDQRFLPPDLQRPL